MNNYHNSRFNSSYQSKAATNTTIIVTAKNIGRILFFSFNISIITTTLIHKYLAISVNLPTCHSQNASFSEQKTCSDRSFREQISRASFINGIQSNQAIFGYFLTERKEATAFLHQVRVVYPRLSQQVHNSSVQSQKPKGVTSVLRCTSKRHSGSKSGI